MVLGRIFGVKENNMEDAEKKLAALRKDMTGEE